MELTIFKLKFLILPFVATYFLGLAKCERMLPEKKCYDGYKCRTWFGYPVFLTAYRFPDECGCCEGYIMENYRCVDINECEKNINPCDQICLNTEGSYKCQCRKGFVYNKNRGKCVSSGPCFKESHFCEHICKALGTYRYRCECRPGFVLASDNISCTPI